jgi:hypothetical protein
VAELNVEIRSTDEKLQVRKRRHLLAQKLGQLQPFIAVFPQECMGQLEYSGPT